MKTLKDLVDGISSEAGLTKAKTEYVLRLAFDKITADIAAGEEIRIHNFGTFKRKDRPERTGRNPSTGEQMTIKASSTLAFKATKHGK